MYWLEEENYNIFSGNHVYTFVIFKDNWLKKKKRLKKEWETLNFGWRQSVAHTAQCLNHAHTLP